MKKQLAIALALLISIASLGGIASAAVETWGTVKVDATNGEILTREGYVMDGKTLPQLNDTMTGASGSQVGAVARKSTGLYALATSACDLFNGASACASALGYADPRWYGTGNICGSNFNSNNSTDDDAPYIQLAINSGYPVHIPKPGCKVASKVNFTSDRQVIDGGATSGYGSNFMGTGAYIFVPNDLAINRATTLNCAFDTRGFDNVTVRNTAVRANFGRAGSVAFCNSVGIAGGRPAAFLNLENVMCSNIGNCMGAAMTSVYDFRGTSTSSVLLGTGTKSFTMDTGRFFVPGDIIVATATGITPTTTMTGTVTSYDSVTGALVMDSTVTAGTSGTYASWSFDGGNKCVPVTSGSQAVLRNNVFQFRAKGLDLIGSCMGAYGNFTDFHATDVYAAAIAHNAFSGLPGYGLSGSISNARIEYSGYGEGPTGGKTYFNQGAGIFYSTNGYINLSGVTCDHQYGACFKAVGDTASGRRATNISLSGVVGIGSHYNAVPGTDDAHFVFKDVDGLFASGVSTYRNGVDTSYVAQFEGTNTYVNWNGTGGAQGSSAPTGQWNTSYFNFITTPTNFNYNVPGVGIQLGNLTSYSEVPYSIGNSGTAFTLNLVNGTFQTVTATGNATVTMPAAEAGKSFTLRYRTGAGGFTAAFTGVKWSGGSAPTLTTGANTMDIFSFISDGTNWYGTVVQNFPL